MKAIRLISANFAGLLAAFSGIICFLTFLSWKKADWLVPIVALLSVLVFIAFVVEGSEDSC